MYIFGVDIPVVEVVFAIGIIGIILLLEITVLLILITYHMKSSRRLEDQIGRLMGTMTRLNKEEIKELDKIRAIEKEERSILSRLKGGRLFKPAKAAKEISPKERKKMYKQFAKKKPKNKILERVDKFLKGLRK
jgi:hypothetical protein